MNNSIKLGLVILLLLSFSVQSQEAAMKQKQSLEYTHKIVPDIIWREAYVALSHYPELKDTPIEFRFKDKIKKSFMQAQPVFSDLFKKRKNRGYIIFMNREFNIEGKKLHIDEVPSQVLTGWLGHELGHVMDYKNRHGFGLIWFGIKYMTSKNYIREAERAADTYAVNHGLGEYIIATKDFILNESQLSETYKSRIKDLYLSQEEIMVLIDELHEETKELREEFQEEKIEDIR
ncbi:hypothetical protein C723_2168 [Christiangramia flava JLT2011]|uniref:Uncharacterized protein n=2 Tax=Christiangramia TaxID=292691 RepID=A0A1L7I7X9_9FLAO|nr:hypothetical protein GRFL_2600 [Christiangramia flava JLT2011]OSS38777.1 hypothetical protein C723_2168 [Christiangramia flava JLT2011]